MKAVCIHQFGGPEVLQYEEVPTPTPGPGQVLVKLAAVGLNYIDVHQRTGRYPNKLPIPWVGRLRNRGGCRAAGDEFKAGEPVAYSGVPGAYAGMPWSRQSLVRMPVVSMSKSVQRPCYGNDGALLAYTTIRNLGTAASSTLRLVVSACSWCNGQTVRRPCLRHRVYRGKGSIGP
jgi:NADPH:quinone reductase-like Zn-dependent oxidoreductase